MFVKEFSDKVKFEEDTSPKYVKAKDLVAGMVYTSTSTYEEDYVYLGKDNMNNYCWSFIGNHQSFSNDPYRYLNYWQNIDRLKSLKKVRGVSTRYPNLRLDVSKLQGINGIM